MFNVQGTMYNIIYNVTICYVQTRVSRTTAKSEMELVVIKDKGWKS